MRGRLYAPFSLSLLVVLGILAVAFFVFVDFLLGVLAEAELLPDAREHEVKELAGFLPELVLILRHFILLPQLFLRLQVEERPTEHLEDLDQQYEDEQGRADVAKSDIGRGIASVVVEVDQRKP